MKLTQNQYYGLRSELPHSLNPGSVYLCEDTREFFIYGESGTPSELKISNEITGITQEDIDKTILEATNALILGTVINVVENYNQLPSADSVTGKFYFVDSEQGTKWLPGSLGGSYYPKGLYHSTGIAWSYVEQPYQANFTEVNLGVNDSKFVTPYTLNNYSKWNSKYDASNPNGYINQVPAQTFDSILNKPFTLSGYGITDAYPISGNPSGFLNSYTETDPVVRAINGIVKSNGTVISAAISGTDYVIPSGTVNSANTLVGLTNSVATLNNQSGVNTGNQTSIVGITGTKTQFDTSITDGNIQFVGDAPTTHDHILTSGATDVTITAFDLNTLDDNSNSNLHFHNSDRDRNNHIGKQLSSTISDIQFSITNNAFVLANTAKITNAIHTGEVSGEFNLSLDKTSITNKTNVVAQLTDSLLISDLSDFDNLKKVTVQSIVNLASSGGNILKWIDYATGFSKATPPILLATIATGNVWLYTYKINTYYRLVPSGVLEDSFYSAFTGEVVSGLLATKNQNL